MLAKLILTSILLATIVVPLRASRDRSAKRGLRRATLGFAAFVALYLFLCVVVYNRL